MYKNYIFDLYGTLVDVKTDESSKNFFKKYAKWLRKNGFSFEWKEFMTLYTVFEKAYREKAKEEGKHSNPEIHVENVFKDVFRFKGYELTEDETLCLCESFRNISLIYLKLFPDTLACLEGLKKAGKKIYLLSNAQKSFTWQELEITGLLPYFDGVLISSEEDCMKPDPDFYNICCERYSLNKDESVMIGNELKSDMAGAKAAGIDGFYINRYPVFKDSLEKDYKYISKNGSLIEVLSQTNVKID